MEIVVTLLVPLHANVAMVLQEMVKSAQVNNNMNAYYWEQFVSVWVER